MDKFEAALAWKMEEVRERLALADINRLTIEIEVEGLVHGSDPLMVEYKIGCSYENSYVKGGDLDACVQEFVQRETFRKKHGTKALSKPHTISIVDIEPDPALGAG